MTKEVKEDNFCGPHEEHPREYRPPGLEIRRGDLTHWMEADAIVHESNTNVTV